MYSNTREHTHITIFKVITQFKVHSLSVTSSRGPHNVVIHCFICSCPLFAALWTGLVGGACTFSLSFVADGDSSLLLTCGVSLAVPDAVTSSGYRRAFGWMVLLVVVLMSDLTNSSAPLLRHLIRASLHLILGIS